MAARISWILIPIVMNEVVQAYFVVMESKEFIDYCDEYSIWIAFLELQSVYEQIMVAQSVGNIGFENFILYALNYDEKDTGPVDLSGKPAWHFHVEEIYLYDVCPDERCSC